ncbi:class-V aminotransferase [Bordetella ansorpii]|uniref:Class-V aminotransferase n=1 Tax=Bordetella ansorpii TaxID=288768 RepID=A0A157RMQ7_9BORD|nr:aminotransferase class V-fold PLP-dependent enzyme [Bordetella ansorpii]SAI59156.1 class-V aminotransferase [Bordetella ansorpii]
MDPASTAYDPVRWRAEFPVTQELIYLDHASMGPLPARSLETITARLAAQSRRGSLEHPLLHELAETTRAEFAAYIGARADQVAYTPNTSGGLSLLASGLDWREGDEIVVPAIDFPSAVLPWMTLQRHGVRVHRVPCDDGRVDAQQLLAACTPRTRLVCASWVQFSSGCVLDVVQLGEACRQRGILFVVDGIQAVGALDVNVAGLPIDALATHSYKWLLGPQGVGWLYLADNLRDQLALPGAGPRSVVPREAYADFELDPLPGAARLETGILPFHLIAGAAASLKLLRAARAQGAAARLLDLTAYLAEGLLRQGHRLRGGKDRGAFRAGIVSFIPPDGDAARCRQYLLDAGIVTSAREGCVRVAPHFYNTEDELDALLARLRDTH